VKQTISCPSDRYRPSYGHHARDHKRQCVFVGTTNRDDWNRDETGARRFWPIACRGTVNLDAVRANREQLFAEAVARFKAGEPHWKMPDEATATEQASRFQADPWLEAIENILKGESSITTAQVAEKLGIPLERRDRANEMRIAATLRHLRWGRKRTQVGNQRAYLYEPEQH
jgi:putative DNA primase/helicase